MHYRLLLATLMSFSSTLALSAHAEGATEVVITGHREDKQPATSESVTAASLAKTTNVATPEDSLRYLPNLLVRQRHIGDTQAPVTTRTSGVGASARSLIYADGILLSSLIGNNNTSASPKWGLVSPEAIARVDVMYGPFSSAYAGNSLGAVIAFTTRMPQGFEATAEIQGASQTYNKYGDDDSYGTGRIAGSIGNRFDRTAFRLSYNHLDSHSQPLSYITATSTPANTTGGYDDTNRLGAAIKVLGSGGLEHQVQDNLSGRLTYDLTPTITAAYTFGLFGNRDDATVNTYLRDTSGQPGYTAAFSNGVYALDETQLAQALSLGSHSNGVFDFDLVASHFDYVKSRQRTPTGLLPAAFTGGPGSEAQLDGTGWTTLDATGTWRPNPAHLVTFGAHQDSIRLDSPKYAVTDWTGGSTGALQTLSQGRTQTTAAWVQDAWKLTPEIKATFGGRWEDWRAYDGRNVSASPAFDKTQPAQHKAAFSPKAVLAWSPDDAWTFKGSLGVAYRFPTVSELYQAVTTGAVLTSPNPNLRPERALSSELSAERDWNAGSVRISLFDERIHDALLSQSAPLVAGSPVLYTYVQNVDRTRATGIEIVADRRDVLIEGLELSGWVTYVDARIERDTAFANAVGKHLPQVPTWRGAVVATYSPTTRLDMTLAARYSDRAFATIDNSDHHANTYQGFSGYFVIDAHVRYKMTSHITADIGINNLNNQSYFLFHPFPQRSVIVDLKYSY